MEKEVPEESPPSVPPAETKRFRLNKRHVVTIVLAVIISVQLVLYLSLTTRYNSLNSQHQSLLSEHATLEDNYGSLQSGYDSLQTNYNSLKTSYDDLESSFDSLLSDYASLRSQINQRVLHVDVMDFVTPNDSAVKAVVLQVTGGWSNLSDWDEYWSDVKEMYDWVVTNIEYRYDGLFPILPSAPSGSVEYEMEMWQFPSETLNLRKGDCEDMAILLASMIGSYNEEKYWVECITIGGSLGGHVGVQLPVANDRLTILDPAGKYYTQTPSGDITNEDISTEINDWLNHWKPSLGGDARVLGVFSSYIDMSFSSISEYISWMYSR